MSDPHQITNEKVIEEVIRITTWRNIRRYNLLAGIAFVIVDLAITLSVVVIVAHNTSISDTRHSREACKNTAALAAIQRTSVQEQAKSTANLQKQGIDFGLSPEQFDKLVQRQKRQDAIYLDALDRLVGADCENLTPTEIHGL